MIQNANQRKGLLQTARGVKEPKRTPKYRRGAVSNIGASLQPPKQIQGEAGRVETQNVAFLKQMQEFIGGKGMLVDQYKEAETARGVAEFEKANVEQREAFKDAINNGWIDNKDSPYFREAVTKAHTKNLLNRTSVDLYTAYEKWEGKNDPNSGSFDTWLAEQDEKIAINLEAIPDHILKADFHEQHQAIKRSLAQRHSAHLNDNYRYEALNEADLSFKALLSQHGNAMGIDFGNPQYDGLTTSQILKKQGINEDRARRLGGLLKEIPIDGRGSTGEVPKSTQLKLEALAVNEGENGGIIDKVLYNLSGVNGSDLRSQAEYERERAALAIPLRERDPEAANIMDFSNPNDIYGAGTEESYGNFADIIQSSETGEDEVKGPQSWLQPKSKNQLTEEVLNFSIEDSTYKTPPGATKSLTKGNKISATKTIIEKNGKGTTNKTVSTVVGKDFMKAEGNSRDLANGLIDSLSKSGDPNSEFISTLKNDPDKSLAIVNKFLQSNPKYKGILGKKGYKGAFPVLGGWEKMEINSTEFAEFAKREMGEGK